MAQGSDVYYIAQRPDFSGRCQLIALQFAVNVVLTEGSGVTDHANRLAFAIRVINGAVTAQTLAKVVLTDSGIQATALADYANGAEAVADSAIDGRLQAMWNAMADAPL